MKDDALMTLAAGANPVPDDAYAGLSESAWGSDTLATILGSAPKPSRWRTRVALAAAAAAAAAVVGVVVTSSEPEDRTAKSVWAPRLVRLAQESPRLLVTAPGWRVTRADGFGTEGAEMTFGNGRYWVGLYWYPGDLYEQYVDDRRTGADATSALRVAGSDAVLFRHDGTALGTTFYALWREGVHVVELRTDVVPSTAEFRDIARSVEAVGVDEWLAALPAGVVKPDERRRAVDEAAAGLPIPPGLDLDRLASDEVVQQRYSLEFQVATLVACGWVDHWSGGDEVAKRESVEALAGAAGWPAFRDGNMQAEYIQDVAAAMRDDGPAPGGGSGSLAAGYRRHLGCVEG